MKTFSVCVCVSFVMLLEPFPTCILTYKPSELYFTWELSKEKHCAPFTHLSTRLYSLLIISLDKSLRLNHYNFFSIMQSVNHFSMMKNENMKPCMDVKDFKENVGVIKRVFLALILSLWSPALPAWQFCFFNIVQTIHSALIRCQKQIKFGQGKLLHSDIIARLSTLLFHQN